MWNSYFQHILYPNSLNLTCKDLYMTSYYLQSIMPMYVSYHLTYSTLKCNQSLLTQKKSLAQPGWD